MKNERSVAESILSKPDEIDVIKDEARKLLKKAAVSGIFPTPVEKLLAAANVEEILDVEEAKETFLRGATKEARALFESGWNKIRGFADLKKRINYIAPEPITARETWVKLHELGHQYLPWQKEATSFIEDNRSLSPECEEEFEKEANAFAGQILFQGDTFHQIATSLRPDFPTIFHVANTFGASRHSAARHLASESDEPIALITYYKSKLYFTDDGKPLLFLGKAHSASEKFLRKYSTLKIPAQIRPDHPWVGSLDGLVVSGHHKMDCGDGTTAEFMWESWWNNYCLLVLVRKTPKLKIVRSLLDL